jgi:hypothetical protein
MDWSDRDWINEGATVHISIIGFDGGNEPSHVLNGAVVDEINPDLTSNTNLPALLYCQKMQTSAFREFKRVAHLT